MEEQTISQWFGPKWKMRLPVLAFFLLVLLLVLAGTCNAQTIQLVTQGGAKAPDSCTSYRQDVLEEIAGMEKPQHWAVFITCDEPIWRTLRARFDSRHTRTAFTELRKDGQAVTVLHGGAWETRAALKETLSHELAHIHCWCSLGE